MAAVVSALLLSLLASACTLSGAQQQQLCSPGGGGGEGSCREMSGHDLPDCRSDKVGTPEACPYRYGISPVIPPSPQECNDATRNDCEFDVVEANLSLSLTPQAGKASITVSWQHLNLSIAPGSVIELRLMDSECPCFVWCISRYFCTGDITQTSYTFTDVRYFTVNQVQLTMVNGGSVVTSLKTIFADSRNEFKCDNTQVLPFNIEFCRPRMYGAVRELQADVARADQDNTMMALVSWLPPAEHDSYNASHHYHLSLSPLSPNPDHTYFFNVSFLRVSRGGSVSIGPLNATRNYSIGVRAYVDCGGCGSWTNTTLVPPPLLVTQYPVSTLSVSTPLPSPSTTLPVPTLDTTIELDVLLLALLGVAGVAVLLLVGVVTVIIAYCVMRVKRRRRSVSDTITPPHVHVLTSVYKDSTATGEENPELPLSLSNPTNGDYIRMSQLLSTPTGHSPPGTDSTHSGSLELNLDSENTSQILSRGECGHREGGMVETPSEIELFLGEPGRVFNVLIVYPPCPGWVEESREMTLALHLASQLRGYEGINPTCLDMVSMRNRPCVWLENATLTADAVLCMWTKQFREDWDSHSPFAQTLKTMITAKKIKKQSYSNIGSILLRESDKQYIPDVLIVNPDFKLHEIGKIVRFIKDMPLCVFRETEQIAASPTINEPYEPNPPSPRHLQ